MALDLFDLLFPIAPYNFFDFGVHQYLTFSSKLLIIE
jgi:hypothetical protein